MYSWEIPRKKLVSPWGGLEFKFKYHLQRERGGWCWPLRGEEMIFRKNKLMGGLMVCGKVCLSVVWTPSLLFCDKSAFPSWWNSQEGIYDNRAPLGGSDFMQLKGVQRKPLPALLFFKYLQLKIINIFQSGTFRGGTSWTPTVMFWGGIFCYPSLLSEDINLLFLLIPWLHSILFWGRGAAKAQTCMITPAWRLEVSDF